MRYQEFANINKSFNESQSQNNQNITANQAYHHDMSQNDDYFEQWYEGSVGSWIDVEKIIKEVD